MNLIDTARALATKAHEKQTRRDGVTPYFSHVEAVALRLPKDEVSQAVAYLHDSKENDAAHWLSDTVLREAGMPEDVIDGRETLTKAPGESYEAYIARIKTWRGGKWVAHKIGDILTNLSDDPTPRAIVKYARALLVLLEP